MRRMTRFIYKPWKEVIIQEVKFEKLENILRWIQISTSPGGIVNPLKFCDGWIFIVQGMEETEITAREKLKGRLRFAYVGLTYMKDFKEEIDVPLPESHSHLFRVPVMNVSDGPFYRDLIHWIEREFPEEAEKAREN